MSLPASLSAAGTVPFIALRKLLKIASSSLCSALLGGLSQRRAGAGEGGDSLSEQGFGVSDSGC